MRLAWSLLFLLLLGGCANLRLIDSQVQSFAPQVIAPDSRYRFERLPSQETDAHKRLEELAVAALSKVGLRHQPGEAQVLVQVSSGVMKRPPEPPPGLRFQFGWRLGRGVALEHQHSLLADLNTQTLYVRHVSLVIRDARNLAVLYETHASNENPWPDDQAVFAALLQAALDGFPSPASGVRRVDISIGR